MNLFGLEIRRQPRARYVVTARPEMTEPQINSALGGMTDDHPLLCAVLQLIATANENAQQQAMASSHNPTLMAGYVGGSSHLLLVRDEILARRAQVLAEARSRTAAGSRTLRTDEIEHQTIGEG